jgi:hypothetical protein
MTKRILFPAIVLLALLFPSRMTAQGVGGGGGESVLGLPVIECRIETSDDQLFFQGNDYNPNRITVTVWVKNVSPEDTAIARDVQVRMLSNTRFIIEGDPLRTIENPFIGGDSLRFNDSASVTYELIVAAERNTDGIDVIGSIVTSSNAYSVTCERDIWVEHEYFPVFNPFCSAQFTQIVFDDNINDYNPNPFTLKVDLSNIGDGNSDSTWIRFIGTRGVSPFPQDTPEKYLDTLAAGGTKTALFQLVPTRRNNDTTVTICFQVRGIGGYKRKIYIDTCCINVFIPAAKQAAYDVQCDIVPDSIIFQNHKYVPDPFDYNVNVRNIGTAVGKDVRAKIILPPSIQLGPGETDEKTIGDLDPNGTASLSWKLTTTRLFERDTLKICVRVFDIFNNQAICCDSVIVDSVRKAIFDVSCICPDTIYADPQTGIYINNPFDVFFNVCNVGSDYADSVKATVIVQGQEITTVAGFPAVQQKVPFDTLSVGGCYMFTWPLQAEPIAVGRTVRIIFRAEALNAEPVECVCEVYVQKLDAPNLTVWCEIEPPDSLHFDPRTGGYFPPNIIFRTCATNEGGGIAKNVQATLAIPPRMILADGETLVKAFPRDLGPNDTACVQWVLIPVKRTDFGSLVEFIAEVTAENVVERPTTFPPCSIFVPALPNTAALAIPRNNVGYTGQVILVPIYIDDPTDKDIKKFQMEIDYNMDAARNRFAQDVVEFQSLVLTNSLTADWTITNLAVNATNDRVNFTIESPPDVPLSYPVGSVTPPLIWLKFRAVYGLAPNELDITSSDILWPVVNEIATKILINDGSVFPRVTDGLLYVSGDCLRPLTASPEYVIFNRPNPFNPATTIEYAIPRDEHVKITVFDALGRSVRVLVDELRTAGSHSVVFDARQLPSGIYFYRMETPNFTKMQKMVVAK